MPNDNHLVEQKESNLARDYPGCERLITGFGHLNWGFK